MYRNLTVQTSLRAEDIDRIRLLLDQEFRRIWDETPFAFDEPTSWASAIQRLRAQFMWLQDSNYAPFTPDSASTAPTS